MCSAPARRHLTLLLGLVAACSHQQSATGEARTQTAVPETAAHRWILTAEEIERAPGRPIEQLLAARFPGVMVTRTSDGGISLRIRGASSFMADAEPLYVIDDVPMDLGHGASLRAINPRDIASIEIVQDAVGTALYGVRGANGVVIIKTKKAGS
jgi:TonB-dependent SusC/RagA subfamily outer membrane receptor